jgi:PPOX class probable F420-dependent enzyme
MTVQQGDVEMLQDPVAQALLASREPAHLAYTWTDGTPRVVPIWFTWTGTEIVFGTPRSSPKMRALRRRNDVAVTIDDAAAWPYRALLVRGTAAVEVLDDVAPEYARAAERYFGPEQGAAWVAQLGGHPMARIAVTPTWAAVLDFETRFPSALVAELQTTRPTSEADRAMT